jgi:outer membrane protein TolC
MRRILHSLSLIIALLPLAAQAQDATQLSLDEAVNYALKHHVKMKNAYLDEKISLARNREVSGLALPNIKGTAGITYAPLVAAFEVPNFIKDVIGASVDSNALSPGFGQMPNTLSLAFQPRWTTNPQLEASQILFDPSVMVALQARKKLEELARKNVELTEEQLKVAVYKAYNNILIAEKRKELLDANITRITQLEGETREIYNNGLVEKVDVDRITVALTNLKTEQNRIKQLVDITYLALKFQIGMPLDERIKLTDDLSEEGLNTELLSHDFDVNNRKEFQLLNMQLSLNRYDMKRYKLGGLPTLAAFGNYGYTLYNMDKLFDSKDKWQKTALVGVKLTVPIFDGFQRRNKMLQAKYALEKTENEIENVTYGLELEKENARITLASNISSLDNQRKNMKLAEEVYNIAKIKYQEGVGSSLEVVTAESSLKEAQTNYFAALYDAIDAKINLQKALGEL